MVYIWVFCFNLKSNALVYHLYDASFYRLIIINVLGAERMD